jgi:DNA helicase-2/ATP-dependent DNA helicase PcrA
MSDLPTEEQLQVIQHPPGSHARVLAVAGSGKTTTMAQRVRYLVDYQDINPQAIQVLMFNRLARNEFVDRLVRIGLPAERHPRVQTFHSFAYSYLARLQKAGLLPKLTMLEGEEAINLVQRAIREVRKEEDPAGFDTMPDAEEALDAIGLWKGSLIQPKDAGYHGNPHMPAIYARFEQIRLREQRITYDDFVPEVVRLLASEEERGARLRHPEFLIVDEYQDVNYGQQRLIEILAGDRADIMVVGDDDQTIYEWRGARPSYITRDFPQVFSNKPHAIYRLSRTFRFGPVLAQAAHNVIAFNTTRYPKPLVSHDPGAPSGVVLRLDHASSPMDVDQTLCDDIEALLHSGVEPTRIAVLCRMFTQLHGLEARFMQRQIPYHVLGAEPFLERREVSRLLSYLRLALAHDEPLTEETARYYLDVFNFPSRMLPRAAGEESVRLARQIGGTLQTALAAAQDETRFPLNFGQRQRVADLARLMTRAGRVIQDPEQGLAGNFLAWLDEELGVSRHFDNYYGKGEGSSERKGAIANLILFAKESGLTAQGFLDLVDSFDPTCGQPERQQIRLTSIFRTKGLEYDYVFIPRCEEGYMPCLVANEPQVFDRSGRVRDPEPSEAIENERRLFYVGITRARKAVYIGAVARPQKGAASNAVQSSRFLEEIQLTSVNDLIGPIVDAHRGITTSETRLVQAINRWCGTPWVRESYLENYLTALGDEPLTLTVANAIARTAAQPFKYAYTYPSQSARRAGEVERGEWKSGLPEWLRQRNPHPTPSPGTRERGSRAG